MTDQPAPVPQKSRKSAPKPQSKALETWDTVSSLLDASSLSDKINLAQALRMRIRDGLTYEDIAQRLKCPTSRVDKSLQNFISFCASPETLKAYQENKISLFEEGERLVFTRLVQAVDGMSSRDLISALDLLTKHVRLLKGESTANVGLLVGVLEEVHKDVFKAAGLENEPPTKESAHAPITRGPVSEPVAVGV